MNTTSIPPMARAREQITGILPTAEKSGTSPRRLKLEVLESRIAPMCSPPDPIE
jgi:hypothetical protein